MIRLGSLAGYAFEGPRLLVGWTPPSGPAVYAIAYKPEPDARPDRYAVIYAGHSDDLAAERFPFRHPRAACWIRRAGSRWKVYICTYEVPGGGRAHREQIARELIAIYRPQCNGQQYDQAWKDEWIGWSTTSAPGLAKDPARPEVPGLAKDPARPEVPGLAKDPARPEVPGYGASQLAGYTGQTMTHDHAGNGSRPPA